MIRQSATRGADCENTISFEGEDGFNTLLGGSVAAAARALNAAAQ